MTGRPAEPSPAEPSPAEPSPAEPSPAQPSPAGATAGELARRRQAAVAGHRRDATAARHLLSDPAGSVRATALAALARTGRLTVGELAAALADPDPVVRSRAATVAGSEQTAALGARLVGQLTEMLGDRPEVAEAAAWALGELEAAAAVPALCAMAADHTEPLCREAAVAALGAIADPAGLAAILAALEDRPAIRRRAVISLAPFEGPEVDAALQRALTDRDWQVRQAAEDLLD